MEDQGTVKVKFPRETDMESGWEIDLSFLARVRHSISPDDDDWIPNHEEVEQVLLALEVIPAGIFTKPKREWVGLTDEDKQIAFDDTQEGGGFWEFADAIEAKLKGKNHGTQ